MRRAKMILGAALGMLLLALPLFAAGKGEAAAPAAPAATAAPAASGSAQWTIPYKGDTVTLSSWMMSGTDNPQAMIDNPTPYLVEWMKRIGNVKWQVYGNAVADYDARFAILSQNGPLYDFNVTRSAVEASNKYGTSGQMLDFMPYVKAGKMPNLKKNFLDAFPQAINSYPILPNGERGLFAVGQMAKGVEMPECFLYNKTILAKYNVAVPTTSAEFLAAMKKLKAADPKLVPFIYMWNSYADIAWYSGMHFMFSKYRPTNINWDPDGQKWVHGALEPSAHLKEFLMFMNEMYTAGLFNPDQETQKGDAWTKLAQTGNWGFTYTYYANARITPEGNGMIKAGATAYEMGGMYVPKGPNGLAAVLWGGRETGGPGWGVSVNAKTKYPDLAVAIIDYLYSDEMITYYNYGAEDVTYKKNADGTMSFLPEWATATNPGGYKDLNKFGLGSSAVPYANIANTSARFAKSYAPGVLAMASFAPRGLYNGTHTAQVLEFARPPVTAAEGDQIGKLEGPINTYMEENVVKFVKGSRSFADWDNFVKDVKNLGVQTILDIYNSKPKDSYIVPAPWTKAEALDLLKDMGQKP